MARKRSGTKVYHVILRGNAKQDIFLDKQDYYKFIKEICNTKEKHQYELYAYCLMTNHVHLIIYDKNDNLSKALQSLTVSYSSYWNKKYERVGHLFQNRFLSKNVETEEYLKNLCRYIHQNPYKSEIAKMEEYKWSSYQEYVKESKIIDEKQILKLFDKNKQIAVKNFIEFHKINTAQNNMNDFMEYEIVEKLNDEQAKKYLIQILEIDNIQELTNYDLPKRNEYLKRLKGSRGISKVQIARLTGLSKRMVEIGMK
jgi:REP element-mobilizing transposase RayT